jgi:two-component system sensor histidine kinase TctE
MSWLGGSLRLRLSVLILVPLLIVSAVAVLLRFENARATAETVFDRNLVMLNLAVSRDVTNSGGDTLSETTSNLFRGASGGAVFYHVYGPDGSFVTGYSSPPVRPVNVTLAPNIPVLFDATHQGEPVRVSSLAEPVDIDGLRGLSVITVWQQLHPRAQFARSLALQTLLIALALLLTVAAVVFFGIRLGLRPLDELEAAIKKRSIADLSPIERRVPVEARGIVQRLNTLFDRLTEARNSRERLISNAAHQLRNPVAAIHTMAQAIEAASTLEDSKKRATELLAETRHTMRLTQQMLSLEQIRGKEPHLIRTEINAFVQQFAARVGPRVMTANIGFELALCEGTLNAQIDPLLMSEALTNLVDNALQHAGPSLSLIKLGTLQSQGRSIISVENDGENITHLDTNRLFERFTQGHESKGAGLGLAIVQEAVLRQNAKVTMISEPRTRFDISLTTQKTSAEAPSRVKNNFLK